MLLGNKSIYLTQTKSVVAAVAQWHTSHNAKIFIESIDLDSVPQTRLEGIDPNIRVVSRFSSDINDLNCTNIRWWLVFCALS